MELVKKFLFSYQHEWAYIKNTVVTVGITFHASKSLGKIVFVDLPSSGSTVVQGKSFGVIESSKAVSDIIAPVSGMISDVNIKLAESPEIINESPYENGWIIKIEMTDPEEAESLLTWEEYNRYIKTIGDGL